MSEVFLWYEKVELYEMSVKCTRISENVIKQAVKSLEKKIKSDVTGKIIRQLLGILQTKNF